MKFIKIAVLFLFVFIHLGCEEDEPSREEVSTSFAFLAENNIGLDEDVTLTLDDGRFTGILPYNVNIDSLVASFDFGTDIVKVDNVLQISGKSVHSFRDPIVYTIMHDDKSEVYEIDITYFTGIPIINLELEVDEIVSKEDYVYGAVNIFGGRQYDDLSASMKIRGRGNSTWLAPKKPYQLKFDDKEKMLDMSKDKKWIFLANYADKSMLRNELAFELSRKSVLQFTPESRFAEVFINDDYRGTYQITQKVEESSNRVDIGDEGFLLEVDQLERLDPDDIYFRTERYLFNIKEGDKDNFNYIKDRINSFEEILFSNDFLEEGAYRQDVDIKSFVDWYLINEIAKNTDSKFHTSVYMHVTEDGVLHMGPIWDYDIAFGNVDYNDNYKVEGLYISESPWIARMLEDPVFVFMVKERMAYFMSLSDQMVDNIRDQSQMLKLSAVENDKVWKTLGNYVWPNKVYFDTYDEEVDYLIDWYIDRMDWLDNEIQSW